MTAAKKALDALAAGATEAEADPGRQDIENAILATVAKVPLDDPFQAEFIAAGGTFTFSRSDLAAVAGALAVSGLEDPVVAAWAAPALLLVGWARVRGGRHTVAQVLAGALVGASVSGSIYRWLS